VKAFLVVIALATPAFAESKADALFDKGKKQLAAKKYAEACATFEKVDKLDTGIGAKLNVAKCFEEWGKLATAYRWYADAEKMAKDSQDKRAPKIKKLVEELDADVPKLTIMLPAGVDPSDVTIQLDGKPVDVIGAELRVDPGRHVIEYEAGGVKKRKDVPALDRGASTEVTLDVPKDLPKKPKLNPEQPDGAKQPPPPPPVTASNGKTRKIAGIAIGGAGLVGLGVAGFITLDARSTYNDAIASRCMGAKDLCDAEGVRITGDARSKANVATVVSIIGVVAIAGGVVLYVTAPKQNRERAAYLAPSVNREGAGVVLGGRF
jgi:hypothetical protein